MRTCTFITLCLLILASLPAMAEDTPPIAQINPETKEITIREKILKKTFQDGGKIEKFEVVKSEEGYGLLRVGAPPTGRTEYLPLHLEDSRLILTREITIKAFGCWAGAAGCEGGHCYMRSRHCKCSAGGECETEELVLKVPDVIIVQGPAG